LKQYNDAAALLTPPREPLTWSTVLKAVTVAEFDLLRDTRTDIRYLPWTEPSRREATTYYFGIKRAKEEIVRLNVEIMRLLTFMFDTHVDYQLAIQKHVETDPSLAHSLFIQWQYEDRINTAIARKLLQTSQLNGFSGCLTIATRLGRDPSLPTGISPPSWVAMLEAALPVLPDTEDVDDDDDIPREVQVDTDVVIQLFENINASD
jgi:hypothetical protein